MKAASEGACKAVYSLLLQIGNEEQPYVLLTFAGKMKTVSEKNCPAIYITIVTTLTLL
jgi:hypothetical protein